jgi:hypothetical protein
LLVGCNRGPFKLAPVSGTVTLDNQPLANATVRFKSLARADGNIAGPASVGLTDQSGRFTLSTTDGRRGAVVGSHIVSISTEQIRMVDPATSDQVEVIAKEVVPQRYRGNSELSFDVPAGGVDNANFALTSD